MSHYDRKLSEILSGIDPASDEAARIRTAFANTQLAAYCRVADAVDAFKDEMNKTLAARLFYKFADAVLGWLSRKLAN